jgi:Family of unknown function (DUF6519)
MKADLTRDTFQPQKHYLRVLLQQGRVELDANWNEQVAILLKTIQTLAADLVGRAAGPKGQSGFAITPLASNLKALDFQIGFGRYYVDGILCEAGYEPAPIFPTATQDVFQVRNWRSDFEQPTGPDYELFDDSPNITNTPMTVRISKPDPTNNLVTIQTLANTSIPASPNPRLRRLLTYLRQPDYPASTATGAISPPTLVQGAAQIYLDVWERVITSVEDDYIREVALGGPDTTVRTKVVWQVKFTAAAPPGPNGIIAALSPQQLAAQFQPANRGWLQAMARQNAPSADPCIINPSSRFTGPENQLYRVEINRGGTTWNGSAPDDQAAATFKWSRENGSVVYPIASGGGTSSVAVESLGRDDRYGLVEGNLVEVQDDRSVLANRTGTFLPVQSINSTAMTVLLGGTPDATIGSDLSLHPLLRRWDQKAGDPAEGGLTLATDNAAFVQEDVWLTLEDGVQIRFETAALGPAAVSAAGDSPVTNQYRTGDYWLIPTRTATGDVEWPRVIGTDGNPETDAQGNFIPVALPPHGITHHYAPLAIANVDVNSGVAVDADDRTMFVPNIS